MENSNMMSKNSSRPNNDYLGVNKMGKNIKKSPLHQPNNLVSSTSSGGSNCSSNSNITPPRQQQPHQPQVYNISKSDFRSVVQRLTGSPLHSQEPYQPPPPRPPPSSSNPAKPPSNRLHRVRPPPLGPIHRPAIPNIIPGPVQPPPMAMASQPHYHQHVSYNNNNVPRPLSYGHPQYGPPSPMGMPAAAAPLPAESQWATPALSPISAYMQQLQSCISDPTGRTLSPHPQWQQVPGQAQWPVQQAQAQPQLQTGNHHQQQHMQAQPHPQFQAGNHVQMQAPHPGPGLLHNPPPMPPPPQSVIPSPRMNGPPALLHSPNSQFLLPSPGSGFYNLSPVGKSSYLPLLSPGSQFTPPLSPNFSFAPPPPGQSGILGPGPGPPSPGFFALSPSGFFPISSPRAHITG